MRVFWREQEGFTIVELLVVVVVIAILAAITIVSYNGIQNQAYEARMKTTYRSVKQAVAMYQSENSRIPECSKPADSSSDWNVGWGCGVANIRDKLNDMNMDGVAGYVGTNGSHVGWAVHLRTRTGSLCKVGENLHSGWWTSSPICWE